MKPLITLIIFAIIFVSTAGAVERSVLARVTVYWKSGKSGDRACWNGSRLQAGHCAVDPKRIPYGSTVTFPDRDCLAVDTGPAVVRRTAAKGCATTSCERNAIVVDRFFETKKEALAWARKHPHFMTLRISDARSERRSEQTEQSPTITPPRVPKTSEWQKWGCLVLEEAFVRAF
jgi:3D (Asp-Asp-Asp) domain-containing protein